MFIPRERWCAFTKLTVDGRAQILRPVPWVADAVASGHPDVAIVDAYAPGAIRLKIQREPILRDGGAALVICGVDHRPEIDWLGPLELSRRVCWRGQAGPPPPPGAPKRKGGVSCQFLPSRGRAIPS